MPEAIPADVVTADDYTRHAASRLETSTLAFLEGGAGDEITLRRNRDAFDRIALNTRPLERTSGGDTRITLFGREYAHPIFLAPVAAQGLLHPDAEIASAQGAAAFDACFTVATLSSTPIESIAKAAPSAPRWFQLYVRPDPDFTASLCDRAEAAGCHTIVVTVDSLFPGFRHRARRAGYQAPEELRCPHLIGEPSKPEEPLKSDESLVFDRVMKSAPTWETLEKLRKRVRLPLIIKGLTTPGDALRALDIGADGLVVSNHGGRVFDGMPASIEMLPRIVESLGGRLPVLLDGGVSRGSDVLKAIALGADAVMIGRPYARALATSGALGVAHLVRMMREELEASMAMTGCRRLKEIGPKIIF